MGLWIRCVVSVKFFYVWILKSYDPIPLGLCNQKQGQFSDNYSERVLAKLLRINIITHQQYFTVY